MSVQMSSLSTLSLAFTIARTRTHTACTEQDEDEAHADGQLQRHSVYGS
jgi:hypothetical protein